jgi:hypothetical protein
MVGEEQYPLKTGQSPERRQDVLFHGVAKLGHALGATFKRGYPREHATSFPLGERAVGYYTPNMMTPKEARFIISTVESAATSERLPPQSVVTVLGRKLLQGLVVVRVPVHYLMYPIRYFRPC